MLFGKCSVPWQYIKDKYHQIKLPLERSKVFPYMFFHSFHLLKKYPVCDTNTHTEKKKGNKL